MLCLWRSGSFWLPLPWCPVIQLWWIQPLCTRLPQQDSSIRNTMSPRQVSFKTTVHPLLKGLITLHPLWAQTWETYQPITIIMPFPQQQEQQQFQKAHIMLPIQQLQWLVLLFCWWMPPLPLVSWHTPQTVTLYPEGATSSTSVTHGTVPQTRASLTPATFTALHREHSWWGKPSHTQDLSPHKSHHFKTVIIQNSPSDSLSDSDNDWFF